MADTPVRRLLFDSAACPDCGRRHADLPGDLPHPGADIDMTAREYDGLRRVMIEDLAARDPSRTLWSPADVDVMLVEAVASVLDELSDMTDRVAAESYLRTARRPSSVRWLLNLIGFDAVRLALVDGQLPITAVDVDAAPNQDEAARAAAMHLDSFWYQHPTEMEKAKEDGPKLIRTQHRMVTVDDYAQRMEDHPLVLRAKAWEAWSGTWPQTNVAIVALNRLRLDTAPLIDELTESDRDAVVKFHNQLGIHGPDWWATTTANPADEHFTLRQLLTPYVDALKMIGTQVVLRDVVDVELTVSLTIDVGGRFFRSEVSEALRKRLGSGPGGLFNADTYQMGEDVYASDVIEGAFEVDGVEGVCVNRFKRRGRRFDDMSSEGVIILSGLELPNVGPQDEGLRLKFKGGRTG